MSMLAGPRRRQKWTLNPRGKDWSEDSNKYGQKMLEKMGWSNGKGLGAREQGTVEHIKVKVKNDQVGVGYKNDDDHKWNETQIGFDSFLKNLRSESFDGSSVVEDNDKVSSGKSLEERSKQSQKRVHYKKFIRGKDVNKYSTKDLANIFGKRDLNDKYTKEEEKEDNSEIKQETLDPIGAKDTTAGIVTIKGGNMNDYFKNKLPNTYEKKFPSQDDGFESETEKYAGFGSAKGKSKFYIDNETTTPVNENSDCENERYMGLGFSKSKKHSNLNYVFDNPCLDLNILDNNSPIPKTSTKIESFNLKCSNLLTPKKRKYELSYENEEESNKAKSKKRKSEFSYENKCLDLESPDNLKISKDGKKLKDTTESLLLNKSEGTACLEISNRITPKTSKKIKSESLSNGYENNTMDVEFLENLSPKKVKQSEEKSLSNGYDNLGLDLEFSNRSILRKSKRNKNKQSYGNENHTSSTEFLNELIPKKNKQNDEISNDSDSFGLNLETVDSPKAKKVKNKNEVLPGAYDNLGLDLEFSNKSVPKKSKRNKNKPSSDGNENHDLEMECLEEWTTKITKQNNEILSNESDNLALDLKVVDGSISKKVKQNKNEVIPSAYENLGLDLKVLDSPVSKKVKQNKNEIIPSAYENLGLDVKVLDSPVSKKVKQNNTNEVGLDFKFLNKLVSKKSKRNKKELLSDINKDNSLKMGYQEEVIPKIIEQTDNKILSNGYDNLGLNLEVLDSPKPKKIKKYKNEVLSNAYENLGLDLKSLDTSLSKKNTKDAEVEDLSSMHRHFSIDLVPNISDKLSPKKGEKERGTSSGINESSVSNSQVLKKPTPIKPKRRKKDKIVSTGITNPALNLEISENLTPMTTRKRKSTESFTNSFDIPSYDLNYPTNEVHGASLFEVPRTTCGMENIALDLSDENLSKKRVTFNDQVEYSLDIVNKKKKKKKLDKYEVVNEKIKQFDELVESASFINEGLDIDIMNKEEIDNELNERKSKKCKRKKERKISFLETIEEIPEEEIFHQTSIVPKETVKEDDKNVNITDNYLCINVNESNQELANDSFFKKKHKKKKRKKSVTEVSVMSDKSETIDLSENQIENVDISEESNTVIKKKNKQATIESVEVTEPNAEIDNLEKVNVCNDQEEVNQEKSTKTPLSDDKVSLQEFLNEDPQNIELEDNNKIPSDIDTETKHNKYQYLQKLKKSKQIVKSLFLKNPILFFNGSNINEIKGYGYDI